MRIVSGLCGPRSAGTQRKPRQGEAGTFAGATTGRPARVRRGTEARQTVWLVMRAIIAAMVRGSHGLVAGRPGVTLILA